MDYNDLKLIEQVVGYEFNDLGILQQAFITRSFVEENFGEDNDVLEFYGDEALDYSITRFLMRQFSKVTKIESTTYFISEYDSGELTNIKSFLVDSEMLSHRIDVLGLSKYIEMGKGDMQQKIFEKDSIKENLFEAIIGAIDVDSDHDLYDIDRAVDKMLNPKQYLKEYAADGINYLDVIQKWNQDMYKKLPVYSEPVFDNSWITELRLDINEKTEVFTGTGTTKKMARRQAAKQAFMFLEANGLFTRTITVDAFEGVTENNSCAKLNELVTRGIIRVPLFKEKKPDKDDKGNLLFNIDVDAVDKNGSSYSATGSKTSKQKAKNEAAFNVLKKIGKISLTVGVGVAIGLLTGGKARIRKF